MNKIKPQQSTKYKVYSIEWKLHKTTQLKTKILQSEYNIQCKGFNRTVNAA